MYRKAIIHGFIIMMAGLLPAAGFAQEAENALLKNMAIAYPSDGGSKVEHQASENETIGDLYSIVDRESYSFNRSKTIDKRVVREFALFNYSRLSNDIVSGSGLYLETLLTLLGVEEDDRSSVQRDFVRILVHSQRIPEFAMEIAEYDRRR
jgi:hypothetical protein